jgi:hypothetical protein
MKYYMKLHRYIKRLKTISNFKLGTESCEHAPGARHFRTVVTQENFDLIQEIVLQDRRITMKFIALNAAQKKKDELGIRNAFEIRQIS